VIENDSPWYATQRGVDTKKLKDEERFAKDEIRKTNEDPLAKFSKEMNWAAPKKEDNLVPLRQPENLLRLDYEEDSISKPKLSFSPPRSSKKSKKENKERRIKKEKKRKRERSYSRSPSRLTRVKREKSSSPEFISESRPKKKRSKRERTYSRSPSRSRRHYDIKRERSSSSEYRSKKKKSKKSRRSPEPAKSSTEASSSSAALIAMLRAKANKRVEREQAKTQELFDKINGVVKKAPEEPEEEVDERKRGYNSCFNPKFQAAKERRRNSEY